MVVITESLGDVISQLVQNGYFYLNVCIYSHYYLIGLPYLKCNYMIYCN